MRKRLSHFKFLSPEEPLKTADFNVFGTMNYSSLNYKPRYS